MASFGHKTRNPGYYSGRHWVQCDRCGFAIRANLIKKTWDGLYVCPEDYEPRHEQDLRRGVRDDTRPKGPVRSESTDTFVSVIYSGDTRAGIARAGLSRCGFDSLDDNLPISTFGGGGL